MNKVCVTLFLAAVVMAVIITPTAVAAASVPNSGFTLVPCGGANQQPCTFDDLLRTVVRIINYLLAVAGMVAAYYIVMAGWNMMSALGNPEKITAAKQGLTNAVIGFVLVFLAFAFVNLALGIMGVTCQWWTKSLTFSGNDNIFTCLFGS
jgi:uncharacterized membrane protein